MKKDTFSLNETTNIVRKDTRLPSRKRPNKFFKDENAKKQKRAAFSPSAELLWCKVVQASHEENKKEKTQKNTKKRSARAARAARYRPLQRGVRARSAFTKFYRIASDSRITTDSRIASDSHVLCSSIAQLTNCTTCGTLQQKTSLIEPSAVLQKCI